MKNIIISGTSSGIGYATALQFAQHKEDIKVFVFARSENALKELVDEFQKVKKGNKEIAFGIVDLQEIKEENLMLKMNDFFDFKGGNRIDVLLHCAGYLVQKSFLDTSKVEWMQTLQVNLFSVVQLTRMMVPYMNQDKGSHIVNIGSMGGVQGTEKFSGLSAYSASKGAINVLTESLAVEFESLHISVNCINPGAVTTPMLNKAFPDFKAPIHAAKFAEYVSHFSLTAHQFMNGQLVDVSFKR